AGVERAAVGLRPDRDRHDAQLAQRDRDAAVDLATIGDQDLLEHGSTAREALRLPPPSRACAWRRTPRSPRAPRRPSAPRPAGGGEGSGPPPSRPRPTARAAS